MHARRDFLGFGVKFMHAIRDFSWAARVGRVAWRIISVTFGLFLQNERF